MASQGCFRGQDLPSPGAIWYHSWYHSIVSLCRPNLFCSLQSVFFKAAFKTKVIPEPFPVETWFFGSVDHAAQSRLFMMACSMFEKTSSGCGKVSCTLNKVTLHFQDYIDCESSSRAISVPWNLVVAYPRLRVVFDGSSFSCWPLVQCLSHAWHMAHH